MSSEELSEATLGAEPGNEVGHVVSFFCRVPPLWSSHFSLIFSASASKGPYLTRSLVYLAVSGIRWDGMDGWIDGLVWFEREGA